MANVDIDDLTKLDPEGPDFLRFLEETYEKMRDFDNVFEAKQMVKVFSDFLRDRNDLRSVNTDLFAKYQDLLVKFRFLAIPLSDGGEVLDVLSKHILTGLQLPEYSLKQALDSYLLTLPHELEMASYIARVEEMFETSPVKLGDQALITKTGQLPPTIQNWIREYVRANVDKQERGAYELISFITNSPNVQRLSKEYQERLKKVLDFYDWLKFPREVRGENVDPAMERQLRWVQENADKIVSEVIALQKGEGSAQPTPVPPRPKVLPPPPLPTRVTAGPFVKTEEPKISPSPLSSPARGEEKKVVPPTPTSSPPVSPREIGGEREGVLRPSGNEELYRETLEELAKMRREEQKVAPPSPSLTLPTRGREMGEAIGVNEALINAATKRPPLDQGSVVAGEKEVEEKLRKLEEKLK